MKAARSAHQLFRFGLFEVDAAGNTLTRNGVRVKIQDQPLRVLVILLEQAGEIVTREELRQALWPNGTYVDFEGSLNAVLKRLRSAIDDNSENPSFVETIPRHGYRFIAPVSVTDSRDDANGAGSVPSQNEVEVKRNPTLSWFGKLITRRLLLLVSVATLLVIAALIGTTQIPWYGKATDANRVSLSAHASALISVRKSAAVLGFQNVTGRPQDAWLSTAIAEMLSTELAERGALRLVSAQDVANLQLSTPWPQADTLDQQTSARIGTALNTDVLVMGSYAIIGNPEGQVRFDVRLQDARTGEILTETSETGDMLNLFPMVASIGGKLRDRLGLPRLESQEETNTLATLPSNREAARLYSLGLAKLRAYDYAAARDLFEQAIKAEPTFPFAHTMLARAEISLGYDDKAKAEAKKGVDLGVAGKLARIPQMQIEATYYQSLGQRDKAAAIYRVLFEIYPDSLEYGLQLAEFQRQSYQPDASLETIKELRRLPPPASDDPALDFTEARALATRDPEAAQRLVQSSAEKAQKQGKGLAYAAAEQALCFWNRQHIPSPPECQEAYNTFMASGNRDAAASTLQIMAETNRLTGHEKSAVPLYQQALRMFKETGDREKIGVTLNNLSLVLENEGQWDQAETYYREARQNFQFINDRANTAVALGNIADILTKRGDLGEAKDLFGKGRELMESSGLGRPDGFYISDASLLLIEGEAPQARVEIETHVKSLRSFGGEPYLLANAMWALGDVEKAAGDLENARQDYQEASDILKKVNFPVADMQFESADVAVAEGHPDTAEALLEPAIAELEKDQSRGDEIPDYTSLSRALLEQGKILEARDAIGQALKIADLHEFPVLELPLRILDDRAIGAGTKPGSGRRSELGGAIQSLRAVVQTSHRLRLYMIECEARLALGELEMKLDPGAGQGQLRELAAETHARGYDLYSRQATKALVTENPPASSEKPVH